MEFVLRQTKQEGLTLSLKYRQKSDGSVVARMHGMFQGLRGV